MRTITALLLLLIASSAMALDAGEFTLNGITANGALVSYTPYLSASEGAQQRDTDGNFVTMSIDKFVDPQDRVVLTNCFWDIHRLRLACGAKNQGGVRVVFDGQSVETNGESRLVTRPLGAKRIQEKLARMKSCTRPTAFLKCTSQCQPEMPQSLLLVYCGD